MILKNKIRKEIIIIRNNVKNKKHKNKAILNNFFSIKNINNVDKILAYMSLVEEVNTIPIIQKLLENKKKVAIPKVNTKNKTMSCRYITDINNDVKQGSYNIFEPKEHCVKAKNSELELVIVPGVVFDIYGNRIGFGAGYYDRFLESEKQLFKIGLCFYEQLMDYKLPVEKHDVKMDLIITDNNVINIKSLK